MTHLDEAVLLVRQLVEKNEECPIHCDCLDGLIKELADEVEAAFEERLGVA